MSEPLSTSKLPAQPGRFEESRPVREVVPHGQKLGEDSASRPDSPSDMESARPVLHLSGTTNQRCWYPDYVLRALTFISKYTQKGSDASSLTVYLDPVRANLSHLADIRRADQPGRVLRACFLSAGVVVSWISWISYVTRKLRVLT